MTKRPIDSAGIIWVALMLICLVSTCVGFWMT